MSSLCSKLHNIISSLPRYQFPFIQKELHRNGIYIVFEKGEHGHGMDRIVRIGTHTGEGQLRSRLKQHFINEKKDRSIFRKNVGRCFLHKSNDPYLSVWELDCTSSEGKRKYADFIQHDYQQEIESKVSQYIQSHFSFCILEVESKEERLYIESRLISTVSKCRDCGPSSHWLGLSSPVEKIRQSGMWQVNELYKQPLSYEELDRLELLI